MDGKYAAFFRQHGIAGCIMRPDFYVFSGVALAADLADAVAAFLAALGEHGVHVTATPTVAALPGQRHVNPQTVNA